MSKNNPIKMILMGIFIGISGYFIYSLENISDDEITIFVCLMIWTSFLFLLFCSGE